MTLEQLGQAVGYTAASVSRMERGLRTMRDVELLRRCSELLGIPPSFLGIAARSHGVRFRA